MKAEILQFVQEKRKTDQAPTCSAEARKAAEQWLALVGTEREAEETKAYLAELEEDIVDSGRLDHICGNLKRGQRCLVRIMQKKWLHMQESSKRQERHIVIVRPAQRWKPSLIKKRPPQIKTGI